MKVFIVDDSVVVRDRLKVILSEIPEINVIGQAGRAAEAINSISELKPDIAILDVRIQGGSGIDVLKYIKRDNPDLVVIMLTNYPYPQYRKKCMEGGAEFFFDKSTEFDRINVVLKQLIQDHLEAV